MMPEQILAEATTFVTGRRLDDNVQILLRYGNGAHANSPIRSWQYFDKKATILARPSCLLPHPHRI